MRYVVEKGFIAVDGVSLTVVNCDDRSFAVTIIPFTRDNTVLGSKKVGEPVNLEADIIAKYVERLHSGPPAHESS
jgi:riboflavin synthase